MTSMGLPVGVKSPKSELHEFYQLHPGNPTFLIKSMSNPPAEPLFLCTLTCPAIGGPQGLAEQTFTGQGRNKRTAEHYAAEKALKFLRQQGLLPPTFVEMPTSQLPAGAHGTDTVVAAPRCFSFSVSNCSRVCKLRRSKCLRGLKNEPAICPSALFLLPVSVALKSFSRKCVLNCMQLQQLQAKALQQQLRASSTQSHSQLQSEPQALGLGTATNGETYLHLWRVDELQVQHLLHDCCQSCMECLW